MYTNTLERGSRFSGAIRLTVVAVLLLAGAQLALSTPTPPQAPAKLMITTKALPNGTVGVEYYAVISASGGEPPYDYSGTGLPANLAFHYTSDTIGGKPTAAGTYNVVITVRDSAEQEHTSSSTFKLTVLPAK